MWELIIIHYTKHIAEEIICLNVGQAWNKAKWENELKLDLK